MAKKVISKTEDLVWFNDPPNKDTDLLDRGFELVDDYENQSPVGDYGESKWVIVNLRLPPSLHEQLAAVAASSSTSVPQVARAFCAYGLQGFRLHPVDVSVVAKEDSK